MGWGAGWAKSGAPPPSAQVPPSSRQKFTLSYGGAVLSRKQYLLTDTKHRKLFAIKQSKARCKCMPRMQRNTSGGRALPETRRGSLSVNQSCIFRVVQVTKSLQDPLEVGNDLPGVSDNVRE